MHEASYPVEPRRIHQPPSPPAGTQRSQASYDWQPNASPLDPHAEAFEAIGESIVPVDGPVPENLHTGSVGSVTAVELTDGTVAPVVFADNSAEDAGPTPDNIIV